MAWPEQTGRERVGVWINSTGLDSGCPSMGGGWREFIISGKPWAWDNVFWRRTAGNQFGWNGSVKSAVLEMGNQNILKIEALFLHFWEKNPQNSHFQVSLERPRKFHKEISHRLKWSRSSKTLRKDSYMEKNVFIDTNSIKRRIKGMVSQEFLAWPIPCLLSLSNPMKIPVFWLSLVFCALVQYHWGDKTDWVPQSFPDAKN